MESLISSHSTTSTCTSHIWNRKPIKRATFCRARPNRHQIHLLKHQKLLSTRLSRCWCSSVLGKSELLDADLNKAKKIHKRAIGLSKRGKLDEALCVLKEGIAEFPDNVFLLTSCGVLSGRKGNDKGAEDFFRRAVDIDAKSATTLQAWGCLKFKQGHIEEAELLFKNAYRVNPEHVSAYQMMGRLEMERNNLEEARRMYTWALEVDPNHVPSMHAWAKLEVMAGNIESARSLLTKILKAADSNVPALLTLGQLEWGEGNRTLATQLFENGLKQQSKPEKSAMLLNAWGKLEAKGGNLKRARELYNKALNLQPLHIHSMLTLGELEAKYGDPLVASKLFKKASSTYPTNAHAKHHVALFYRQFGKYEDAKKVLHDMVRTDPDCGVAWHTLGEIAMELGEADEAIQCFSFGKESSDARSSLMCFEGLAQMWYFQGKTSLARECYVNGARTQLCTGRFLRMWATMERRLKNDNQASRIFKAAAKVDPQDALTWIRWAQHERNRGQFDLAEDCYERGLEKSPSNPYLWYGYTHMCSNWKDPEFTRTVFKAAVKACPRDGPLLMEMALFEQSQGNVEDARLWFEKGSSLPITKSHPPLFQAWSDMESILGNFEAADELMAKYTEILKARERFLMKQRVACLQILGSSQLESSEKNPAY